MNHSSYIAELWDGCIQQAHSREWVVLVDLVLVMETVAAAAAAAAVADPVAGLVVKGEAGASGSTAALLPQRLLALPWAAGRST